MRVPTEVLIWESMSFGIPEISAIALLGLATLGPWESGRFWGLSGCLRSWVPHATLGAP